MRYRYMIIGLLFLYSLDTFSQGFYVKEGVATVGGSSYFILHDTHLESDGEFRSKDLSQVILRWQMIEGVVVGNVGFQNLILDGSGFFESDLTVLGDIRFRSGILDIGTYNLSLGGILLNEREDSYIFSSSTGRIYFEGAVSSSVRLDPGNLGLDFTPTESVSQVSISRGNMELYSEGNRSVLRNYQVSPALAMSTLSFKYFDHEENGLDANGFAVWNNKGSYWQGLKRISSSDGLLLSEGGSSIGEVTIYSTSVNSEVVFPSGFTPNGDGVNDYYVIGGALSYPNSRLVVFDSSGNILYDVSPYQNDWDGRTGQGVDLEGDQLLEDGTYFYIFYKDATQSNDVDKGFIELKTQ
ncbi:gliding motility-associated C-terminal domain-containing protein [Halosquirtibacter xylanolyticus]|uniref:gliding motility-associated C-terminal domain-containing protein n=1 Tax=Halosquirtibacter xylanolyticus TaxID=3374599 RepID=UPI00374A485B|nr:gliding motility-associated C-terminal domain-containing protein [Prolixibacteraceae bacterium]